MTPSFLYKTQPYAHQRQALERSYAAEAFALLMQMRTGKTKVIIDTATYLYSQGKIDAVVVVAPNGVHRNWVTDEIPAHSPDEVQARATYWASNGKKADRDRWEALLKPGPGSQQGLRYFTFNFEAIIKGRGHEAFRQVVKLFRVLLVSDESQRMKNHTAAVTKLLLAAAPHAEYRRIMTGTSITEGPLDLYAQFKFLDPHITGHQTFTSFRSTFGQTEIQITGEGRVKLHSWCQRQGRPTPSKPSKADVRAARLRPGKDYFEKVTGYQRLDALREMIAPYSIVVRRQDCEDMPKIIDSTLFVELTPEQRRIYDEMLEDSVADLAPPPEYQGLTLDEQIVAMLSDRNRVRAQNALGRLLRLQQILGGFVPDEAGQGHSIDSNRLKTTMYHLEDIPGKVILWARFRPELAALEAALVEKYGREAVVAYHGGVSDDDKMTAKHRFQNDDSCRYFVSNPASGGVGLPLYAADTMIYYSNSHSAEKRWQSEERATLAGKHSIAVIDVVTQGTVDEAILTALHDKREVADDFADGLIAAGAGIHRTVEQEHVYEAK